MKPIIVLAAGALGAAGAACLFAAAPASADVGCAPKFFCDAFQDQPRTFVNNVATSTQSFTQIVSGQIVRDQVAEFGSNVVNTPGAALTGILSQPALAIQNNPVNQLGQFAANINPLNQLNAAVSSIKAQFGPDNGPTSNTVGDEDP
jgi:hypothetical protein